MNDSKKALQSSLWKLTESQQFLGSMIQELTIKFTSAISTAAITFSRSELQFEILLNADFFCSLSNEQRTAVLHHEILHFTNSHLLRFPFVQATNEERMLYNIAGDMAINQYIRHLPENCINVADWNEEINGKVYPFPLLQSMETYYEKIKKNKELNNKQLEQSVSFDEHDWESMDEKTKQKMLEEAKKIINRTIEKTINQHSIIPNSVKELLQEIESIASNLNYKQILSQAIKKNVSSVDRINTWKRANKRYGLYAPGTKLDSLPKLSMYLDSSGSISVEELNKFLTIVDKFLKVGVRTCTLNLWHTNLYYKTKYNRTTQLDRSQVESGGTDINCVLMDIKNCSPALSLILTDGYYDNSSINVTSEVIFIISKGGQINHPLKEIGKTIYLEDLDEDA